MLAGEDQEDPFSCIPLLAWLKERLPVLLEVLELAPAETEIV